MTEPQRHTLEEAIAYWQRRYETEPEPLKSFAREHLKGVLLLQDGQNGIVRGEAMAGYKADIQASCGLELDQ